MANLPKMTYEQQQMYNTLGKLDLANGPYIEGEDIMVTIARKNIDPRGINDAAEALEDD